VHVPEQQAHEALLVSACCLLDCHGANNSDPQRPVQPAADRASSGSVGLTIKHQERKGTHASAR